MGPLDDENKLQVDKKNNKKWKIEKSLKMYRIVNFKTICSELTASGNIIHSILILKLMGPVSFFSP